MSTQTAATGTHTTNGTPHGYSTLTPFVAVPRAADAMAFYEQVFGARTVAVTEMGGLVVHAELDFGNGRLQLGEPNPTYGLLPPPGTNDSGAADDSAAADDSDSAEGSGAADDSVEGSGGGDEVCYSLAIYVPDADAVVDAAQAAGATVREPVVTFVSGDRFGSIRDPFGIRWSVMTRVEDLSDEESAARVAQWAAQQG